MQKEKIIKIVPLFLLLAGCLGGKKDTPQGSREYFNPFENVAGITESAFKKLNQEARHNLGKEKVSPYAGKFSLYKGNNLSENSTLRPIQFNVMEGAENPDGKPFREKLDTPALQAAPENAGAVFQVASNFDCLEGGGGQKLPIMQYISPGMYVQGEASSVSAMPGTIYRMYFQKPVNLLEDFSKQWDFNYTSGYITSIPKIDEKFGGLTDSELIKASHNVYVGIQKDVCVTGGYGPTRQELRQSPHNEYLAVKIAPQNAQRITQVFTAALNPSAAQYVASTINPYHDNAKNSGFKGLAKLFLYAAYEKTISYSDNNTDKVYLTLVGGGAFQNKLEWIAQAINYACHKDSVDQSQKPLEVNLVVYNSAGYKDRQDWAKAEAILKNLVARTGGSWTRYTAAGEEKITV